MRNDIEMWTFCKNKIGDWFEIELLKVESKIEMYQALNV